MARKLEMSTKAHAFFALSNNFVNLRANARNSDDFYISLSISDGENVVNLSTSEWAAKERIKMFQALQKQLQVALEFYEKALKLPKSEPYSKAYNLDDLLSTPGKKAKAKKKPAAKKTTP